MYASFCNKYQKEISKYPRVVVWYLYILCVASSYKIRSERVMKNGIILKQNM